MAGKKQGGQSHFLKITWPLDAKLLKKKAFPTLLSHKMIFRAVWWIYCLKIFKFNFWELYKSGRSSQFTKGQNMVKCLIWKHQGHIFLWKTSSSAPATTQSWVWSFGLLQNPHTYKEPVTQGERYFQGETRWTPPESHMAQQGRDWPVKHQLLNRNSFTSSSNTTPTVSTLAEGDWRSEQVKYFYIIISLSLPVSLNSLMIPSHKTKHLM